MDDSGDWFERVWEYREETLYPRLFGTQNQGGIYVLTFELFKNGFDAPDVDPRWLHHGVLVYPPSPTSRNWRYVTSGLSNAWEDDSPNPEDWSGMGLEFVLETAERHEWAIEVTSHILAYQLLLAAGRFGDPRWIEPHARIPLNAPIDGGTSQLTYIVACVANDAPEDLQLESGKFSLLQLVGATQQEIEFARQHGGDELLTRLKEHGAYPATDPDRASVV